MHTRYQATIYTYNDVSIMEWVYFDLNHLFPYQYGTGSADYDFKHISLNENILTLRSHWVSLMINPNRPNYRLKKIVLIHETEPIKIVWSDNLGPSCPCLCPFVIVIILPFIFYWNQQTWNNAVGLGGGGGGGGGVIKLAFDLADVGSSHAWITLTLGFMLVNPLRLTVAYMCR